MTTRGPKPKPTAIKKLEGNPGKRKLNDKEPKPTKGTSCPDFLPDAAKSEWTRLYKELRALGVVTTLDRGVLAALCIAWATIRDATERLDNHGSEITCSTNKYNELVMRPHPYVSIRNAAIEKYLKCAAELGCTPSARSRLSVEPPASGEDEDRLFRPTAVVTGNFKK